MKMATTQMRLRLSMVGARPINSKMNMIDKPNYQKSKANIEGIHRKQLETRRNTRKIKT